MLMLMKLYCAGECDVTLSPC